MPHLAINNIQLYYELHGQGEPLLFIHGLGASTRDWEYQVDFFAKHFQVILFDLRGHGQSDKPVGPYSISLFASDTAQLIAKLFPQGVDVIGHSLGGMVAFQLALDFPKLVNKMVIVNSAPAVMFPSLKDQLKFLLRTVNVKLFGMKPLSIMLSKKVFPHPEQVRLRTTFIQHWCDNDPDAYLSTLKAFKNWNLMDRLPNLTSPTLIVTADQDYTPVAYKHYYAAFIPKAEVVVISNSNHLTIVDQADKFNAVVLNFLTK